MARWERTRLCGCGECRFKPDTGPCPKENDPGAKWLWAQKAGEEDETGNETQTAEVSNERGSEPTSQVSGEQEYIRVLDTSVVEEVNGRRAV